MIQGIGDTLMDQRNELYSYSIPMEHSNDDDEDGIVHEFTTQRGERHVVIMTKSDTQTQQQQHAQEGLSMQERLSRLLFSLHFAQFDLQNAQTKAFRSGT